MPLLSGYIHRVRTQMVADHAKGDVLDIGCQRGQMHALIKDRITSYAGIDIDAAAIEQARQAVPDGRFEVRSIDTEGLVEESAFDTVIMCAVIEHIFNQRLALEAIARALKPGGRVVITTPTPLGNDVVHALGAAIGLFSPAAQDDHIVIYNRKRFRVLAQEVGLELAEHRYFQLRCNQFAVLRKPG